jgi:hypothetical protein
MNWLLLLVSTFSIQAFATSADVMATRAQSLLGHVVMQDGPNCYNASLYLQGFTNELVYTSDSELGFYLQHFCSEKPTGTLAARDLVTFVDSEDRKQILHTLVSLNGNLIVEKSSLMGALTPAHEEDPQPGHYLKHDISESLYSSKISPDLFGAVFTKKTYRCQSSEQVALALSSVSKSPAIQEQLRVRKELSQAMNIPTRPELEQKILTDLVPMMSSLKWDQHRPANQLETAYLQALLRSNAYQMHLLNCAESMRRTDECYVPQLKESTTQTDAWFQKIYAFEKKYHLK